MLEAKYKINGIWIISVLSVTIILLITIKWSTITDLGSYLTFALTVTSLVLAIVAIFYTIYSNAGFETKLNELSGASREISGAATQLSQASMEVRSKVEGIPQVLKDVGDKVQETQLLIKSFSAVESRPAAKEKPDDKAPRPVDEGYVDFVLSRNSVVGSLVLYMCLLSFQKRAPFTLTDLWGRLTSIAPEPYALGFIVAFYGTTLMQSTQTNGVINVTGFNEILARKVKATLDKRAEGWASENPGGGKVFRANITTVESYFQVTAKKAD